ncbi:MAG: response regulator [Lachnospiraceae bacterium]|nr:response regulator [Lachnospiraceae bacterium]
MYRLIIVDDEPLVQVGVRSMLNWNRLDIEVVGTASNGRIALDLIEEKRPDIVITDIKMPVIDGLELVRLCREKYGDLDPHFIFLTSYEEFQLARQAIIYGVSDYLVKVELSPSMLEEAVTRVIADISKKRAEQTIKRSTENSFRDKFFIRLLNNLFETEEQFSLQSRELGLTFDYGAYTCCTGLLCSSDTDSMPYDRQLSVFGSSISMIGELAEKYAPAYCIALDMRHFAVIFCGDVGDKEPSEILSSINDAVFKYYKVSFTCGIGTREKHPLAIGESYRSARMALVRTDSEHPILCFDSLPSDRHTHSSFNMSIFKDSLTKAFEEYDPTELSKIIDSLCALFSEHPNGYVQALDAASNILYLAISLLPDGEDLISGLFRDHPDGYRSLYRQKNVEQIVKWLSYFGKSMGAVFDERRSDHKNHIVSNVKKYISEHICEKLVLDKVAAAFGISPNYLSQLFGRYSDLGFSEYVNSCKIKKSKELLATDSYKVYEVADMLGYESSFYFSKVFKKVEGISPTDYLNLPRT